MQEIAFARIGYTAFVPDTVEGLGSGADDGGIGVFQVFAGAEIHHVAAQAGRVLVDLRARGDRLLAASGENQFAVAGVIPVAGGGAGYVESPHVALQVAGVNIVGDEIAIDIYHRR